jgi:hypothetical protein
MHLYGGGMDFSHAHGISAGTREADQRAALSERAEATAHGLSGQGRFRVILHRTPAYSGWKPKICPSGLRFSVDRDAEP